MFYNGIMPIIKFKELKDTLNPGGKLFIREYMCQDVAVEMVINIEESTRVFDYPLAPVVEESVLCTVMLPSNDFVLWASACQIDIVIESTWSDGCVIYIPQASDIAIIILAWNLQPAWE